MPQIGFLSILYKHFITRESNCRYLYVSFVHFANSMINRSCG